VVVAKAGVNALSNNLAIEMGPLGVTSNVIALGPIEKTEGMDRLTPASDTDVDMPLCIPLGRQGSVKDIADATIYFVFGCSKLCQ
jgi:peroxisomal 2,4-dienoyl-CoA reductase